MQIQEMWDYAAEESGLITSLLKATKGILTPAQEGKNKVFAEVNFSAAKAALEQLKGEIERVIPHAICTVCNGVTFENCTLCKGRGFISKFLWDNCVDDQTKKLRETLARG